MKYLFIYKFKCTLSDGTIRFADGSTVITNQSDNRITKDCIFGDNGAVDIVKRGIEETGGTDVTVAPMGWFKFDDEDEVNPNDK